MFTIKYNIKQRNKINVKRMGPGLIKTSTKRAPDNEIKTLNCCVQDYIVKITYQIQNNVMKLRR